MFHSSILENNLWEAVSPPLPFGALVLILKVQVDAWQGLGMHVEVLPFQLADPSLSMRIRYGYSYHRCSPVSK